MKKYENYVSALNSLRKAPEQDLGNDFIQSGIIDKFGLQFELGWKLFKALQAYEGDPVSASGSPRDVLKTAFQYYDFMEFRQRDVLSDDWEKSPSFDVIVSNPPYVTEAEKDEMEANVLDWEPALALFVPDDDPLRFYRRIATLGRELLLPGGKLYFEINRAFGREIAYMLEMNQYRDIRVIKDIFGKDRIVTANR